MKRLVVAGMTATVACGLLAVGLAPRADAVPDPYPESKGWIQVEGQQVIPAGYACRAEIVEDAAGHVRSFTVSKTKSFADWGEDTRSTLTNTANGRSVTVDISGDGLVRDSASGRTEWITAFGGNTFYGRGVKGIRYGDGVQKLKITKVATPKQTLHLRFLNGAKRELCAELGSSPVKGRNLPEPTPSTAPTKVHMMVRR